MNIRFQLTVLFLSLFVVGKFTETVTYAVELPTTIPVTMYVLRDDVNVGEIEPGYILCGLGSTEYGCSASGGEYKHGSQNPAIVDIEEQYLPNLLAQEVGEASYSPIAREAIAIAARSYTYYHAEFNVPLNNSTEKHVYIPDKFDSMDNHNPNTENVCDDQQNGENQRRYCDALENVRYLTNGYSWPEDEAFNWSQSPNVPILAEYSSDVVEQTRANIAVVDGDNGDNRSFYPYLASVSDPISWESGIFPSHGRGISQNGASRWAYGNSGRFNTLSAWPVRWQRSEQILFHYYTGVDLRDATGSVISPDYRWNLLNVNWESEGRIDMLESSPHVEDGLPIRITADGLNLRQYQVKWTIQNTGVQSWICSSNERMRLGYRWYPVGSNTPIMTGSYLVPCGGVTVGETIEVVIPFRIPIVDNDETYIVEFDMLRDDAPATIYNPLYSFAANGWDGMRFQATLDCPSSGCENDPAWSPNWSSSINLPAWQGVLNVALPNSLNNTVQFNSTPFAQDGTVHLIDLNTDSVLGTTSVLEGQSSVTFDLSDVVTNWGDQFTGERDLSVEFVPANTTLAHIDALPSIYRVEFTIPPDAPAGEIRINRGSYPVEVISTAASGTILSKIYGNEGSISIEFTNGSGDVIDYVVVDPDADHAEGWRPCRHKHSFAEGNAGDPAGSLNYGQESTFCNSFNGEQIIAYGVNGQFTYFKTDQHFSCGNNYVAALLMAEPENVIGSPDPSPTNGKSCYLTGWDNTQWLELGGDIQLIDNAVWNGHINPDPLQNDSTTNPTSNHRWEYCGEEGEVCLHDESKVIAYGEWVDGNRQFVYHYMNPGQFNQTSCNSETFGVDPAPSTIKACWIYHLVDVAPLDSYGWEACAIDGNECQFDERVFVAYGTVDDHVLHLYTYSELRADVQIVRDTGAIPNRASCQPEIFGTGLADSGVCWIRPANTVISDVIPAETYFNHAGAEIAAGQIDIMDEIAIQLDASGYADYYLDVDTAGTYHVGVQVASNSDLGTITFKLLDEQGNVVSTLGSTAVPDTGGTQQWQTAYVEGITLDAGIQRIRVEYNNDGFTPISVNTVQFLTEIPSTPLYVSFDGALTSTQPHHLHGLLLFGFLCLGTATWAGVKRNN